MHIERVIHSIIQVQLMYIKYVYVDKAFSRHDEGTAIWLPATDAPVPGLNIKKY